MEHGDACSDGIDGLGRELAGCEQEICAPAIGKPDHMHRPIDDWPVATDEAMSAGAAPNRHDPPIDLWRKTRVEPYLRVARGLSLLDRSEVHKAEIDRLF